MKKRQDLKQQICCVFTLDIAVTKAAKA